MTDDKRLSAPSALRNRDAILTVLRQYAPEIGHVLEVASGTGEHVTHFAMALPGVMFQPSDLDPKRRDSVDAWARGAVNIRPTIALDTTGAWPEDGPFDAVVCINMIHIAPWAATIGLIEGGARVLRAGGVLLLYGPYHREGQQTAASNEEFDADLKRRNPEWGLRDLGTVAALAEKNGFAPADIIEMAANNLSVVFRLNP